MKYVFLIIILYIQLFPLFNDLYISARAASLGGSYVSIGGDAFTMEYNPASIGFLRGISLSATYFNHYTDVNIHSDYFGLAAGTKYSSFGFNYKGFIVPIFKEEMLSFMHAIMIFDSLALGYGVKRYSVAIKDYRRSMYGIDAGVYAEYDRFSIGMAAKNINHPAFTYVGADAPVLLQCGIAVSLFRSFLFIGEITQEMGSRINVHIGQEYAIRDIAFIRAGFSSEPRYVSIGAGVALNFCFVDYGLLYHPELGATHVASVKIEFIKKEVKQGLVQEEKEEQEIKPININKAGEDDLLKIIGEGELVQRIIAYREKSLFYRKEEIVQVEGIDEIDVYRIERYITVSEKDFSKDIYWLNHVEAEELAGLGLSEKSIIEFLYERDRKGHFSKAADIRNIKGIHKKEIELIEEYIKKQ
ncbi:helix-hairpin-helix domain-containing protein [Spirochaetota bacterium]